jgi:hypothetical protein
MSRPVSLVVSVVAFCVIPVAALAHENQLGTPSATPVSAADTAFEIAPVPGADPAITAHGYFVYTLAAGSRATGALQLRNIGSESVTIELAAVDAETAQTGGSAFSATAATPAAAGAWLRLDESRVNLSSGAQAVVGFSVQPPPDTSPGQYLAGLAAAVPATAPGAAARLNANQASAGVTMQTRYVIGVQVDVPGVWTPSLTITGASALDQPSGTKLGIGMRNDGGEFLKPRGAVTLIDAAGRQIINQPIELGTFVTGTEITYPIPWPEAPRAGDYAVAVELNYADNKVAHYNGTLNVSANAPAARPEASEVKQPAVAPQLAPFPIPLWIFTVIIVLLALIAVLLILVVAAMVRGERHRGRW